METHIDTEREQLMTQETGATDTVQLGVMTDTAENIDSEGQKAPTAGIADDEAIDKVSTQPEKPTRLRKQKSFTMSEEVHGLLAAQAERNSSSMSAHLEMLILIAEDLSFNAEVMDLLGSHASRAGLSKTEFLEVLIRRADHVVTWDDEICESISTLASRAGVSQKELLTQLIVKAGAIVTWEPPQPKARPWWRFWEQPTWEAAEPVFVSQAIVEAEPRPQLPG